MSIAPCAPTPVTPGIVVFVPGDFRTAFPSFSSVTDGALTFNFSQATLMLENSCCSVVRDAPQRQGLLNLLTAHITALLNGVNGQPPQGIVGRVNSATEGSVSVQADYGSKVTQSQAYFVQTPWGAMFWQATLPFRTARYVPPPACDGPSGFPWEAWPE